MAFISHFHGGDLNQAEAGRPAAPGMPSVWRAGDCPCLPASPGLPFALLQRSGCRLPPSLHKHTISLACRPQLWPCSWWFAFINHHLEGMPGRELLCSSLSRVLADTRSSHILVLKTWLPLYHCLQTGYSCDQQRQPSGGANSLSLSLPPFLVCGFRGQPHERSHRWSHVSYTRAAVGIPASGMGEGKAKVKVSKRKTKGVNTQCVSVVLARGVCNEDTGFCGLIKRSRGWALCRSPKMAEHQHVPSTPPGLETLSSLQDQALQLVNTDNKTWVFSPL